MDVKKVFENLARKGMFICSDDSDNEYMLVRNSDDKILFRFKLMAGIDTLTCLKMRIDRMKAEVESCFKYQ